MERIKKPKIKSIPYEEFTDNETLEKLVCELNAGGANVALGVLDDFINWDAAIRCGRLRLQQAVAVSSSWHWVPRAMTWRVSDLK